ncbi:hypothetical protein [Sinorhizobium meliloti]|uniref:hypothetical protein n=1 Tax=Rhizobium meliloti TaxID=382 RepID=UPI000FD83D27|nr:hypothetical protein [Sinorhizobium meliloti]RVH34245.1 hypothetical protein CN211_16080 [Sinorhizobium meliloti]
MIIVADTLKMKKLIWAPKTNREHTSLYRDINCSTDQDPRAPRNYGPPPALSSVNIDDREADTASYHWKVRDTNG